eukprot:scaffold47796_cov54-Phaeocystis_antarctica.AAC.1
MSVANKTAPWRSSTGYLCSQYVSLNWCSGAPAYTYGTGWLAGFGTFAVWAVDGLDGGGALQAAAAVAAVTAVTVAAAATAAVTAAVAAAQPVDAVLLVRWPRLVGRVQGVGAHALPDLRRRRLGHRQRRRRARHAALIPQPGALGGLCPQAESDAQAVARRRHRGHQLQRLHRVAAGMPAKGARVARLPADTAAAVSAAAQPFAAVPVAAATEPSAAVAVAAATKPFAAVTVAAAAVA